MKTKTFLFALLVCTTLLLPTGLHAGEWSSKKGGGGHGGAPGSGPVLNFVIGDRNSTVGMHVTFWGAQWAQNNSLTGGAAPSSFKGYANSSNAPTCGGTWTSRPGNSSGPPASLPSTITVFVSSSVTKSGSAISGDVKKLVVVQVDPGYQPNPGHAGTGTVISVTCTPCDAFDLNGTACNDGNACTTGDSCQAGVCVSGSPVVCTASDQCHDAGVCDPATGLCLNPPKADGTPCDDGNASTVNDLCTAGVCAGI